MNDTFRLDLAGYDKTCIEEVLGTFVEGAPSYGRKVAEIRISRPMPVRLGMSESPSAGAFKGVPVAVADTGFDDTIEVVLAMVQ